MTEQSVFNRHFSFFIFFFLVVKYDPIAPELTKKMKQLVAVICQHRNQ